MSASRTHKRSGSPRGRRGSILILVIALLVLMALIGTAFITTATTDRYAASQHTNNTQVDLLIDGVMNATLAKIVDDIVPSATGEFRTTTATGTYDPWDGVGFDRTEPERDGTTTTSGRGFLASRVPDGPNVNSFYWSYLSASPLAAYTDFTNTPMDKLRPFSSPWTGGNGVGPYAERRNATPTWLDLPLPNGGTIPVPALVIQVEGPVGTFTAQTFVAADADGDGIADAGLFRLPGGQINGVTYFGATRVIDNNSAINASIAWQAGDYNLTPVNVDLAGMLPASGTDLNLLLNLRQGNNATANLKVIGDDGNERTDFVFGGPTQATTNYLGYWMQCGRRLDNPGFNMPGVLYTGLPLGESTTLASRFSIGSPAAGRTDLENALSYNLGGGASRRAPFTANQVPQWFQLFDYTGGVEVPQSASLRALLTARNAVTNYIPGPAAGLPGFTRKGAANLCTSMGDWYTVGNRAFVCITDGPTGDPASDNIETNLLDWAEMPWGNHPTKININSARYDQLVAAYIAVFGACDGGLPATNTVATKQLRTPLTRDWNGTPLTRRQAIKLRAAIAAVNTIDLRDPDDDVTSRAVNLGGLQAMVYGSERQPYITEVVVHIDKDPVVNKPYVAIELYNPTGLPISLKNWKLALRSPGSGAFTEIVADLDAALGNNKPIPPTDISVPTPPVPFIVLENVEPGARPTGNAAVTIKAPPEQVFKVAELDSLVENISQGRKDLYLLRPRLDVVAAPPAPSKSDFVTNKFDEAVALTARVDLVPADQVSFEGIRSPYYAGGSSNPNTPPVTVRFRYARATSDGSGAPIWQHVYAGPFSRTDTAQPHIYNVGWVVEEEPLPDAQGVPAPGTYMFSVKGGLGGHKLPRTDIVGAVGAADPRVLKDVYTTDPTNNDRATYRTRLLPVAAPFAPTPGKGTASYPFGYFARNGDMMQVPFVGSYRVNFGNRGEVVSTSLDSVFAHDGESNGQDTAGDDMSPTNPQLPLENIGRFSPISLNNNANPRMRGDDFAYYAALTDNPSAVPGVPNRYAFALRLLDVLTVQGPQMDYLPDVDPSQRDATVTDTGFKWGGAARQAVANGPAVTRVLDANQGKEDTSGVEGLININTAPWRVLATLPLFPAAPGAERSATTRQNNILMARALANFRDVDNGSGRPNGPFRSIFEIVNAEAKMWEALPGNLTPPINPLPADGDVTPDATNGGFEQQNQMMIRLSNLITTRSDTFTVYVLVQGWRGAGTNTPELVVQRRLAYIVDRSTLLPKGAGTMTTTVVPLN